MADPGKANLRSCRRRADRLLRSRADGCARLRSPDSGHFGVRSGQTELPANDPGEIMGRVGMEIVESGSPGSFQHDRPIGFGLR